LKLTINKSALIGPLSQLSKISGSKSIDILNDVLCDAREGTLQLTSGNGNGFMRLSIETAEIASYGVVAVNAKKLEEIVKKAGDRIELSSNGSTVTIKTGKSKFEIAANDAEMFPTFPVADGYDFELSGKDLREAIEKTVFAVGKDASQPVLQGVLFEVDEGDLTTLACDRHRLAKLRVDAHAVDGNTSFNIHADLFRDSRGLFTDEDTVSVSVDRSSVLMKSGNKQFYARLLEGSYPDTSRLIPSEFNVTAKVSTSELITAIERAFIVANDDKTNIIKVTGKAGELTIEAKSQTSKVSEAVDADINGEFVLSCNAKYVLDALKTIDEKNTLFQVNGAMTPFVLTGENNTDNLQLILPYRTTA
jgi:DNA polymerase-3 subunit beta